MAKRRFSRDQAREALLATGLELIAQRGPSSGVESVSFADAIEASGVPRPSAYRVFSETELDPQVEFRRQLVHRLVDTSVLAHPEQIFDAELEAIFAAAADPQVDSDELTAMLRQVIRLASLRVEDLVVDDAGAVAYLTVLASSLGPELDAELIEHIRDAEARAIAPYIDLYRQIGDLFGLVPQGDWTWERFAFAIGAAQFGAQVSENASAERGSFERPTGPDGEAQRWSHLGLMAEAIYVSAFGPDPDREMCADPRRWLG